MVRTVGLTWESLRQGWLDQPVRNKSLVVLTIPLFSIILSFSLFFLIGRQEDEAEKWLLHTAEVKNQIHRTHKMVIESEAKLRGYFLIGQPRRLETHRQSRIDLAQSLEGLEKLVGDNPTQVTRAQRLRGQLLALEAKWDQLLVQYQPHTTGSARPAAASSFAENAANLDKIRLELAAFEATENYLMKQRQEQADAQKSALRATIGGGILLGILGSVMASLLFSQGVVRRIQRVEKNAQLLAEGAPLPPPLRANDEIGRLERELATAARLMDERESQFRNLFEAAGDGIVYHPFTTDTSQGHFLLANDVVCQMLGYSSEEIQKLTPFGIQKMEDSNVILAEANHLMTHGKLRFNRHLVRKDGSLFPAELQATTLKQNGQTMVLSVIRDVTEQRETEKAIREAKEQAEQAQEEAEVANQAKSDFLSRMSHELRTPLNAILGFGQLLEMGDISPRNQKESVEHILKAGRHLLNLINEVLEIASIEAGRLPMSLEPVQIGEVLQEVLDLAHPLALDRRIYLRNDISHEFRHRFIHSDRQKLKQVLLNLVANAIKYNRDDGVVIISASPAPLDRVRLSVQDTGSGIASERLNQLFQPFERLGAEQTGVEGTGLGLALSQRLVEAMHGQIGVESTVGQGSAFWVEFAEVEPPLLLSVEQPIDEASAQLASRPAVLKTLLCIEDNVSNLNLIEQIFARRADIKLMAAMQGRLGLELAREHRPDLILLDLHLPDMGGVEVLRFLNEMPETKRIPVVIVSADATEGQIKRLLDQGAQDYLTKPINVQELLRVVNTLLRDTEQES